MTDYPEPDALLSRLAQLPAPSPRADRDNHITRRCHAVLRAQRAMRARSARRQRLVTRCANVALAVILCSYAAVTLILALQLMEFR